MLYQYLIKTCWYNCVRLTEDLFKEVNLKFGCSVRRSAVLTNGIRLQKILTLRQNRNPLPSKQWFIPKILIIALLYFTQKGEVWGLGEVWGFCCELKVRSFSYICPCHGVYGLYGCLLSPKMPLNLITHSPLVMFQAVSLCIRDNFMYVPSQWEMM